jgi:hypothetical protein
VEKFEFSVPAELVLLASRNLKELKGTSKMQMLKAQIRTNPDKKVHQSQFLEAPLVRQADSELKNPNEMTLQISCVDVSKYLRFY